MDNKFESISFFQKYHIKILNLHQHLKSQYRMYQVGLYQTNIPYHFYLFPIFLSGSSWSKPTGKTSQPSWSGPFCTTTSVSSVHNCFDCWSTMSTILKSKLGRDMSTRWRCLRGLWFGRWLFIGSFRSSLLFGNYNDFIVEAIIENIIMI